MTKFTPWHKRAACKGKPTDWFFGEPDRNHPGRPSPETMALLRRGLDICRDCPVRTPCLAYALHHEIEYGVWGGTTQHDRRILIRRGRRERLGRSFPVVGPSAPTVHGSTRQTANTGYVPVPSFGMSGPTEGTSAQRRSS